MDFSIRNNKCNFDSGIYIKVTFSRAFQGWYNRNFMQLIIDDFDDGVEFFFFFIR